MADTYQKILLVEDEAAIADMYANILRRNGFEVDCAYDGDTGLQTALSKPVDLILLDIMLPGKSGIDVLHTLRDPNASPQFDQSTVIFLLTNFDEDEETKKSLLKLAQAYLIKVNITPLTLANLLKTTVKGAVPDIDSAAMA
ncbi:MAG: response regulator [Candidatus Saccharibacteria bacterium]